MSFAIEVPGAAVPLSMADLYKALEASNAADHSQRQAATDQLQAWQTQPGFYSALQTAFLDRSLPGAVRLVAVIILKNGVDRNWRSAGHVKGGVGAEEKGLIRSRLFSGVAEERERTLALQGALVAAKIVRIDYPQDWSGAMAELVALLRQAKAEEGAERLAGVLLLLLRVIKELASARLRRSQTALQHVAEELAHVLGEVYGASTAAWTASLGSREAEGSLATSLAALKVLRQLMLTGFETPLRSRTVQEFWALSQRQLEQFLGYITSSSSSSSEEAIGKHLLQLTKLHVGMSELHPASFAGLPNSVALVQAYWGLVARFAEVFTQSGGLRHGEQGAKMEGPLMEKVALRGLLLVKSCTMMLTKPLQTFKYRSEEAQKEQAAGLQTIKQALFTDAFMLQVVDVIVTKLFVFRASDLAAWEADPEGWEAEESEAGAAWEWQVRPCAEKVFLSLLIHNKALLVPPLLRYLQQAMAGGEADLLTKEAVYTALGHAAVAIEGALDFGALVTTTLVRDAQAAGSPLAKVLRRRVAIVLGAWAFCGLPAAAAEAKFAVFAQLLREDDSNDVVVRVTAARQLKTTVDEIGFEAAALAPRAGEVAESLLQLLAAVESDETKLAVLETLRVLVERMETAAAQFGDRVMAALPAVWAEAEAEDANAYMVKQSVLTILAALLTALGARSKPYHGRVLPLIAEAASPQSALHQHLLEEALELWSSLLAMSTAPLAEDVLGLLPLALPLLEYDSPVAVAALHIVQAYAVLAPAAVLSERLRAPTLSALGRAFLTAATASNRNEPLKEAAEGLRLLIRAAQRLGGAEGTRVVAQALQQGGVAAEMLTAIHGAWTAHQSTGPRAPRSPLSTTAEVACFAVLGQVAVADPGALWGLLAAVEADVAGRVWPWLAAEWFASVDNMGHPEQPKLACLALTRLCELPDAHHLVLGHLQDYLALWTSVVVDAQDGRAQQADSYVWAAGPPPPSAFDAPLMVAQAAEAALDPVHVEHTYAFVRPRLQALVARAGGEAAFEAQWMANVDQDVVGGFRGLG